MNVNELVAIDVHTHAEEPCGTHPDDGYDDLQAQMAIYFNQPNNRPTIEETASYYRERKIGAVIFPVDAERETGYRRYPNEEVAEKAAANSDVLIPFASIDPAKGKAGAREARRLIREFGVRGFKFHPSMQGFYPNDRSAYVLYEAIAELGAAGAVPYRPDRGWFGHARRRRNPAEILKSDVCRRRGRRFSRNADHSRPSVVPVAGRGTVGCAA